MGQARQNRIHREKRLEHLEARITSLLTLPADQVKALQVSTPGRDLDVGDHHVQLGRHRRVWVLDRVHQIDGGIVAEFNAYRHDGTPTHGIAWTIQKGVSIKIIPANAVPLEQVDQR